MTIKQPTRPPLRNVLHAAVRAWCLFFSAKSGQRQQLRPERRQEPVSQKWQTCTQSLPPAKANAKEGTNN